MLLANRSNFERFANFAYVPMPGGAAAIKHPLRMAYGVLWAYDLLEHPAAAVALAPLGDEAEVCDTMIERGLNTPMTSSVGRLFDAASALLGICTEPSYEGEGAILLEAAMETAGADEPGAAAAEGAAGVVPDDDLAARERYAVTAEKNTATETSTAEDTSVILLDAEATFHALLDDLEAGRARVGHRAAFPRRYGERHCDERRAGAGAVRHRYRGAVGWRVHEPVPDRARAGRFGRCRLYGRHQPRPAPQRRLH